MASRKTNSPAADDAGTDKASAAEADSETVASEPKTRRRRTPRKKSVADDSPATRAKAPARKASRPAAKAPEATKAPSEALVTAEDVIAESLDGDSADTPDEDTAAPKRSRRRRPRKTKSVLEGSPDDQPLTPVSPISTPSTTPAIALDPSARALVEALREALMSTQHFSGVDDTERRIALFCDLENLVLGLRDEDQKKFDINLVLERLREKGKIIVKKAYADWERYSEFKRDLHDAAIELIDIPHKKYSGKNSADIKMVVDAMELASSNNHLDTFVVLSGDSDFSPLVSKLREKNHYVIGIGVKNSSSRHLIDNCDEFIFYEDIWRDTQYAPQLEGLDKKQTEVFTLMNESINALIRENKDVLWGSMVKQTMQRKRPSFNEGYFGYSSFSELLQEAERRRIITLKKDSRSGSLIVTGFART